MLYQIKYQILFIIFINRLYEATLIPICNYIHALENVVNTHKKNNINPEIKFPSKILNSSRKTVFFLAEHEAQFQFLYDRQLIFHTYI